MKLLEVSFLNPNDKNGGGVESYIRDLSNFLRRKGIEVTVISAQIYNSNKSNQFSKSIKIPRVISLLGLTKIYYNIMLFFYVKYHGSQYDIIHINGDNGFYIPYIKHKKTIMTLHGSITESLKSGKSLPQHSGLKFYLRRRYLYLIHKYLGLFEEKACRRANIVISVSNHLKDYFGQRTGRTDINVINPCVFFDKNYIINKNLRREIQNFRDQGNLICLWVGRDPVRKGLDIAKKSVKKMKDTILYTAGCFDVNVGKNIFNLGPLSRNSLLTLYDNSDVLLFPSKYEGFSIVIIEGMSHGLVPITLQIPSAIEIISNRVNGFICFNEENIHKKLTYLLNNKNKLNSMKTAAKKRAIDFDCNVIYQKFYDLIIDLNKK